jgi:hypothetical protein
LQSSSVRISPIVVNFTRVGNSRFEYHPGVPLRQSRDTTFSDATADALYPARCRNGYQGRLL